MQKRYLRKTLSPKVTAYQRVALVQLMEESAELIHIASKTLRWGFESYHPDVPEEGNNADRLSDEIADVNLAYERVLEACREKAAASSSGTPQTPEPT